MDRQTSRRGEIRAGSVSDGPTRWLVLALLLAGAGCQRHDTEGLARIGRKLRDRAEAWSADFRDQFQLDLAGDNSLETRLTQRLRGDKALADLAIEIKVNGKEIELNGIVADLALKRRAVDLAEATVGVEKVVDNLQLVAGPPAPVPATP